MKQKDAASCQRLVKIYEKRKMLKTNDRLRKVLELAAKLKPEEAAPAAGGDKKEKAQEVKKEPAPSKKN